MARGSCGAKTLPPPHAQPKSQLEFTMRDTEESEFLDLADSSGFRESQRERQKDRGIDRAQSKHRITFII